MQEHDPVTVNKGFLKRVGNCVLHSIDKRSIAFETVSGSLADLDKEVVERNAKDKNLQDLCLLELANALAIRYDLPSSCNTCCRC